MLKGIFLIICAATCWGMGGVAGQYLYQYHQADMIWLCMVRQILAGCMFLLFAAFVQKQDIFAILKADTLNIIEFSFLGILGAQLGFYYTIGLCNAATATVLQYMAPLYVMLWMSYKSRKIPDVRELIGIVGALVGVFLIATHGTLDSLAISPMALTIGVLSALSYAYYSIKPGQMLKKYTAATLIGWGQLISGVALSLYARRSVGYERLFDFCVSAVGCDYCELCILSVRFENCRPYQGEPDFLRRAFGFYYLRSFAAEHKIGNG